MKKATSKVIAKDEIRFHNTILKSKKGHKKKKMHPAYVWRARGNTYDYYTLTHSKWVPGVKVRKLTKNPNPKDMRDSYIAVKSMNDKKGTFTKKQRNWALDPADKAKLSKKTKKR